MRNTRLAILGAFAVLMIASAVAQQASKHMLSGEELKKAVPAEYFFRGQKAPVQVRNSVGFQLADGKMTLGRSGRRLGLLDRDSAEIPGNADH